MLIQIVLVVIAAAMLVSVWRKERQGALAHVGALGWSAFWIAVAVVALRPELSSRFASAIGVGRGVDAVVYVAVIALFWLHFRVILRLERMERDLTSLVRTRAIEDKKNG